MRGGMWSRILLALLILDSLLIAVLVGIYLAALLS